MSDVPSNLIPTRVTQLPLAPVADENSLMMIVWQGNNYQIRVGDLLSVAGVPTSRQVIAGTGLTGGGQLTNNVTLSIAPGGVGTVQLAPSGVTSGQYGSATEIPVFGVDSTGRVVNITTVPVQSGGVPTTRQVIAGTGLNGGGALNANVTLNANLSNAAPLATDGLGSAGVSTDISRADHQHPSVNLQNSSEVDGVLPLNNGGTARSLVMDEGAIIWSGADGLYVGPVGAIGQMLQSNGTGEYVWVDQDTLDVGQADNINGGVANQILYQTGVGTTGFVPAPTATNTVLYWNGSGLVWGSVPGTGTVTSVGLALPSEFGVTGSPVTGAGTLTGAWIDQAANLIFAGPNTGVDDTPAFRSLVNADLPNSGVTANTYGSSTVVPVITVNAKGVITSVTTSTIIGTLSYQGGWNANTNTPTLASGVGTTGYYYVVTTAGTTNLDGITDWQVGDWAIFNGTAWQKVDQTNTVASVNGQTGVVVLTASDVGAQPADAQLTDIAGLTPGDGNFIVGNGTNFVTESGSTARTSMGAAASGANSDITSMSGLTGGLTTPEYIDFDTSNSVARASGRLWWDNSDGVQTLNLGMAGTNATMQIGEEIYYRIKASSAITEGDVVMFSGSVGASGALTGAPATGLTAATASYVMGVATESIALNGWGYVTAFGLVRGIDTSGGAEAWVDGQILYYNPAVAGGLTKTVPSAPNAKIQVCAVVNAASGGSGSLFVRPTFGGALGQFEGDVGITSATTNDLLRYDTNKWVNTAASSVTVGTATNVAGGAANKIVYNTNSGTTSFIDAPTLSDTFLKWNGSAFAWATNPLGTVTSVDVSGGTTGLTFSGGPITSSGTMTMAGTLGAANGGLGHATYSSGDMLYASGATTISKLTVGTTNYLMTSSGTAPQWTNPSSVTVGNATNATDATNATNVGTTATNVNATFYPAFVDATTGNNNVEVSSSFTFNPSTNTLTATNFAGNASTATSATTATNLAGGAASQIPYQSGSGATTFLANGTAGQVLTSAGSSAPTWGGIDGGAF